MPFAPCEGLIYVYERLDLDSKSKRRNRETMSDLPTLAA
ncbi:hypothetical protein ABI_22570 [Asticcacaulis biprosthecium C19]|uniref:Uncharacterized protein n=1 Tax=Asticcacaulis biprosthecium C19 TaxID=715226 RepID=F4QND8_9CAUL|nr:hypothetical protein ABI_22570 [Asticcacaulis biprosthecium C19]